MAALGGSRRRSREMRQKMDRSAAAEGRGSVALRDGINDSAWIDRQPPGSQRA